MQFFGADIRELAEFKEGLKPDLRQRLDTLPLDMQIVLFKLTWAVQNRDITAKQAEELFLEDVKA